MENIFENKVYSGLEKRAKAYASGCDIDLPTLMRDIREASLYGKIESYEEIHLLDILDLEQAEDIDDGYIQKFDETTGGIQTEFEKEEEHDMSYLDDYEEEEEEEESGFLGFLK